MNGGEGYLFFCLLHLPISSLLYERPLTSQYTVPLFLLFSCISGTTTSFSLTHYNFFVPSQSFGLREYEQFLIYDTRNQWCFGEFAAILTYDDVQKGKLSVFSKNWRGWIDGRGWN